MRLACADDDAQGQSLEVFWDYEIDRWILEEEGWAGLADKGFDPPRYFAAFFNTLRWHCTTATDANLFQAPFRAGITIDAYQMEPLRKALRLPRVNLFIADDTGLGKTIEAGLIARELLLRPQGQDDSRRRAAVGARAVEERAGGSFRDPVAADWPELLAIVEERVKPERDVKNDRVARDKWWQFLRPRPELHAAIAGLDSVLAVNCGATPHMAMAFLPARTVFANTLDVFPFDTCAAFCVLQSRLHEIRARFFGSSMKDDLRYTPSDCFDTFPFPDGWETHRGLEDAGRYYYDFRAASWSRPAKV